jgi:hypothetical protein
MKTPREVAEQVWPQHAELCGESDWHLLEQAINAGTEPAQLILEPHGEAKDAIMVSLMIVYWTMKIVNAALEIRKSLDTVPARDKSAAVLAAVTAKLSSATPDIVRKRLDEILNTMNS